VDGRAHVLNNEPTFDRLISFLLDSPTRYRWFGRRFVIMPDHIHLIAHTGQGAVRLGQWIKALKAVVGGLESRESPAAASGDAAYRTTPPSSVGRVTSRGVGDMSHEFTRIGRAWRWQAGFHDHKFRAAESESRKWEYVCLNPVRCGLVKHPEEWPFAGEIFYEDASGSRLVRGTPPLLDTGLLIEQETPREGTRPAS
jgi:REP element-mobilizing transposase RayT